MIPQTGSATYSPATDSSQRFRMPLAIAQVYKKPEECAPLVVMLSASEFEMDIAGQSGERTYEASGIAFSQPGETFMAPLQCAALLEYGHGAAQRSIVMDWRTGSYNLPPCTFVRVSLWSFKNQRPERNYTFQASIAEGHFQTGDVPTFTAIGPALGDYGNIGVPSGARALELVTRCVVRLGSVDDSDTFHPVQTVTRTIATFEPPWSPVRIETAPVEERAKPLVWNVQDQDDDLAHVRFLLSL